MACSVLPLHILLSVSHHLLFQLQRSSPLDFISAVQACMSSSTSSNTTVLLLHDDTHLGFCGATGGLLVYSGCGLLLDVGLAPLFLSREKSGILLAYTELAGVLEKAGLDIQDSGRIK